MFKLFKTILFIFASFFLVSLIPFSQAHADIEDHELAIIRGKIFDQEGNPLWKANVTVVCDHNGTKTTVNRESWPNGGYLAIFRRSTCADGDALTVTAQKDGLTGTSNGTALGRNVMLNVAMLNVTVVPEFGILTGAAAILTSAGSFWFIKKGVRKGV